MRELPILFNGEMVRAILDGRKTQTRRVIKPQPNGTSCTDLLIKEAWANGFVDVKCPYGQTGDLLWVRETWREMGTAQMNDGSIPPSDGPWSDNQHVVYASNESWNGPFRPSIHMPRWASRITLEVTGVRVERVQEIIEADAVAEGCKSADFATGRECILDATMGSYRLHFQSLWNSINVERGFGWDVNPWVWVIKFRRVNP